LPQVLIVDDDPDLLTVCRVGLGALGHAVRTAETAGDGLSETAITRPDVIVLDLGLPDLDGVEVCKRIRTWSDVPIVVLSADGTEDRKVEALEAGADDYITKPFGMRELNARLRVAIRHHVAAGPDESSAQLEVGQLSLDLVHYQASFGGKELELTPREFDFLAYLARHAGKVCTRRIGRKLGDERGLFLQSDPSVGYRLAPPGDGD